MSLADHLKTPAVAEERYQPSVEFDARGATISTGTVEYKPDQPPEYADILRSVGRDPDRFHLVEILYEKHWQVGHRELMRDEDDRPLRDKSGKAVYGDLTTTWLASYKLRVEPIAPGGPSDLEALIAAARRDPVMPAATGVAPYWFVFQAGDLQLGKVSRDGSTEEIVTRFTQSVERAKRQLRAWSSLGIAGVQISMPGDCIEGNQSQQGRNNGYLTQLAITEQTRVLRRLMMLAVQEFSGAPEVKLDVVNGNHDQSQRQLNTWPGDGWATEQAIAVRDALALTPGEFGHVEVRIPEKWSGSMTVPVGDSVVTVVHGHQWRRNGALRWLSDQAVHNQPAGACHVVQHGHWHTWMLESHATKSIVGSPTFDCGSDWFREHHGGDSRRGALSYLLRSGEISRMGVV
ncbi:nuclease [Mycobacterium phage MalagasyRose]|uniref:Nuclease n=1 Tax=Mycobacterium phage MalagasyRose TaxID=2599870 RepID=A0A5J6TE57_9CAUD|nr:nuclease [Mycobacterium phage MalagasyRose]QFG08885.1 nuclease [Mycobacterium phage MalagasyRose]